MSSMIEVRFFLAAMNREDLEDGLPHNRLAIGPPDPKTGKQPHGLFKQAQLQYRTKEKVILNGHPTVEWGEWQPVPFVREGVDDVGQDPATFKAPA